MNTSWLEMLILTALLLWSGWVVLGRFLPGPMRSIRGALSVFCQRRGWNGLALRLRAPAASACATGCSSCGGCDSAAGDTQIVQLKAPASR